MADPAERTEFVNLLTSHQRRLYGYIATLMPNPADCEEILQQTNLVLWAKADEFEPGTSFRAWSFRIAYLEVISHCRRCSRERRLFGGQLLDVMAGELGDREAGAFERSAAALRHCLEKLAASDRELITHRYSVAENVQQLAAGLGRSASSVYRSLDRIRYALLECIQNTLAAEDCE